MKKQCSKCGKTKGVDEFGKDKYMKDGRKSFCKDCRNAYTKAWRKVNPEKVRAAMKKWYKANPEKAKANTRDWQKANPEKTKAFKNSWQKANPEKKKASNAKAIQNLPDCYVKGKLKNQGYPPEMISPELIEVKRTIIKIKRACKKAS